MNGRGASSRAWRICRVRVHRWRCALCREPARTWGVGGVQYTSVVKSVGLCVGCLDLILRTARKLESWQPRRLAIKRRHAEKRTTQ